MPENESCGARATAGLFQVDCELVQLLEHDREKRVDTVVDELVEVSLGLLVVEVRPELLVHLRERAGRFLRTVSSPKAVLLFLF